MSNRHLRRRSWALGLAVLASPACREGPRLATNVDAGAVQRSEAALINAAPTGAVDEIVRGAVSRARANSRRVVVYAGATWCEPCQTFHHALEAGELASTFPDVDFLAFDVDRDRDRLLAAGYRWTYIPLFALPGPSGLYSGKPVVQGGIKGEDILASLVARLRTMLSGVSPQTARSGGV